MAAGLVLTGCATREPSAAPAGPKTSASSTPSKVVASSTAPTGVETTVAAQEGRTGRVVRVRFVPDQITLTDRSSATVVPAETVGGLLQVPTDVRRVGWWDGSAEAGDPYGATVVAGHVDSRTQGLGYFARLRPARPGDVVTLAGTTATGRRARLAYRVTSVRQVRRDAVSADSAAFDQGSAHRLVLITCGGAYVAARGGYQDNVVIIAAPVAARR